MYNPELQIKTTKPREVDDIPREENQEEKKADLLMSPLVLDNLKKNRNSISKMKILEELEKTIDRVVGESKMKVFDTIVKANEEDRGDKWKEDLWKEHTKKLRTDADLDAKLISLPEEILGELLKPLPRENQERIYVQRDTIDLKKMLEVYNKYSGATDIAFHVSDRELKGVLKAGPGENAVFFSTDIKRLFNKKDAKYIYAFRMNKKNIEMSKYCGVDCFGKISTQEIDDIQIDDSIKIFDEKDPSYRKRILDKLAASFETSYRAANDHASAYMESR